MALLARCLSSFVKARPQICKYSPQRCISFSSFLPNLGQRIRSVIGLESEVQKHEEEAAMFKKVEDALFSSDMGKDAVDHIMNRLKDRLKDEPHNKKADKIVPTIHEEVLHIFGEVDAGKKVVEDAVTADPLHPKLLLLIGSNGVGKTTTAVKLCHYLTERHGKGSVLLSAGDTFRAAAVTQLAVWAQKLDFSLSSIPQKANGKVVDPCEVLKQSIHQARKENIKFVLFDTAGRIHNNTQFMQQLKRIRKTAAQLIPNAPHHSWLVLDGTVGSNSIAQAKSFQAAAAVDGVILTKMDSTARGGVAVALRQQLKLPVIFVGTGEQPDDLMEFDVKDYVDHLIQK